LKIDLVGTGQEDKNLVIVGIALVGIMMHTSMILCCLVIVALLQVQVSFVAATDDGDYLIPNIVHQTYDYKKPSHFFYMSLLSVQHFQKPDKHFLWVNSEGHHADLWQQWQDEALSKEAWSWEKEFAEFIKNGTIEAKLVVYPSHPPNMTMHVTDKVHRSDFLRMNVLRDYGGIYIDGDVLILKPVEELRRFHFITTGDNHVNPDKYVVHLYSLESISLLG
jgi:hypothetical protein